MSRLRASRTAPALSRWSGRWVPVAGCLQVEDCSKASGKCWSPVAGNPRLASSHWTPERHGRDGNMTWAGEHYWPRYNKIISMTPLVTHDFFFPGFGNVIWVDGIVGNTPNYWFNLQREFNKIPSTLSDWNFFFFLHLMTFHNIKKSLTNKKLLALANCGIRTSVHLNMFEP